MNIKFADGLFAGGVFAVAALFSVSVWFKR